MAKVAIIGAGSIVFCKTLMLDIMATEGLEDTEFALMAPSTTRTTQVEAFAKRVIDANGLPASVWKTTDRREAVKDADFVITTFQVGGVKGFEYDYKIPLKYGVDQCIGDTLGPGGVFRALRGIPVMLDLATDMEELCPEAYMLQYVNPMAMVCWALGTTKVKFVGLCHGVQTTLDLISGYADVPKDEIDFLCAGINHMAWFLKLKYNGRDLYPILRERFEVPEYYVNEKVRGEVFRHFGYFMTESTGHLAEYVPYFRKNQEALDLYCDEPAFGGESGAFYNWCKNVADKYSEQDILIRNRGAGDRTDLQAERERDQRWHDHQPAGRLLRRGTDLCRQNRPAQNRSRRPTASVCRFEPDEYQCPEAGCRGCHHWRPRAYCPRLRSGSADWCRTHPQRDQGDGRRDA
jgi:alpha-galactosidase